jgi:diguanylate cyclase (GGDEF)-like protein/PAS domain S-box-containing protein
MPAEAPRSYALALRCSAVCVVIVVFMLVVALATATAGLDDWQRWTHLTLLAIALFGLFVVGRRWRHDAKSWMVMFAAFLAMSLAQIFLGFGGDSGLTTDGLQPSDVFLALWGLGLIVFLVRHLLRGDRLSAIVHVLDAAMMTLSIMFVLWEQVIGPAIGDPGQLSVVHQVVVVLLPGLDVMVASILFLLLLVDRSPARLTWFVATLFFLVGDVVEACTGDHASLRSLAVSAPCWIIGLSGVVIAAVLPAGARITARRPTVSRLVMVNATVVVAFWVATWHYVIHGRPATVTATVIGLTAGVVWAAEHIATYRQSVSWADQLNVNIEQLGQAHVELRALLDDLPEAVVVLNGEGRIREVNTYAMDLTGRTRDQLLGRNFGGLFRESERGQMLELWNRMRSGGSMKPPTFTFETPDGREVLLEADVNMPLRDPERVVVALRNVTERVEEAHRLERARERFRLAFHNAPTGMALVSVHDGVLIDVNDSLVDMLGRTRYELIGSHIDDVTHPQERGRTTQLLQQTLSNRTEGYRTEQRFLRGDGATVWARTWVSVMADDGDSLAIAHIEDITEQRHTAERMEWAATHDGLTGLPNRFRFLERLGSYIEAAEAGSIAVLFIDIDNFKVINDSLGHDAGDQLLRAMSDRLRTVVRDRDLLGRFGGDEFIVMLRDVSGNYDPIEVAERLRTEIAKPVLVDGAELYVTASIGITVSDREGVTTSEMLRDADAAMYRAKARGRDCVEVFAPGSHDASVLTLRTTNELRRGIDRGEIVPYYQPIVRLDNGHLVGFEVLARWRHPDRGLLVPEQFLPLAEETGLIGEVGTAMLQTSLGQLGQWRSSSPRFSDLSLSVNLSVRQLASADLVEMVSRALTHAGVSAGALWLEITETALMSDVKAATVTLRELRSLGLHLSVDDFGTGYSSLTYLKRFPVEAIKVDRSFVNGLGIDAEDSTIVEAVVKLGHSLGLQVVAEGVETPLQLSRLREIGCDRGQGYLFGRPRPAELIESEYSLS